MGGFMFARGVGREHWDEVMKNQKTHIQKWHKLQVSIDNLSNNYQITFKNFSSTSASKGSLIE